MSFAIELYVKWRSHQIYIKDKPYKTDAIRH